MATEHDQPPGPDWTSSGSGDSGGFTGDHVASLHTLLRTDTERGFARDAAVHVAESPMRPVTKLALLAKLKAGDAPRDELEPIATSLLRPDVPDKKAAASDLIDFVQTDGADPLHRGRGLDRPTDPTLRAQYDEISATLDPELENYSVTALPLCKAHHHVVRGQPALFVTTEVWAREKVEDFADVVDPLMWPKCPVQSHFFKSMEIDPATHQTFDQAGLDSGWRAQVTETVDFGPDLGLFGVPTGKKVTKLDMTYCTTHLNGQVAAISTTYNLVPGGSLGDEILFDEGYLVAERRDRGSDRITRLRTKKAVWFADKNTPANMVCGVWSFASALIATDCLKPSKAGP